MTEKRRWIRMPVGIKPSADVVFAVRMMMIRYNLTPADMLRILVVIDKGGPDETK